MSPALVRFPTLPPPPTAGEGAEAILAAVVFGARTFMNADGAGALESWLERLGVATGADQVRIFANDDTAPGEPASASLCAEWIAPGAPGSPMETLQRVPYGASGVARWEQGLARGEAIVGNTDDLPEGEREILRHEGDRSVAIVPVFVGSRWWGFMGFADCRRERTWSPAELDALAAAAGIYGAALARQESERRVAAAKAQERLATEIGQLLTAGAQTVDELLERCSARIAHHLGADLVRVWTLDRPGELLCSQGGASTLPVLLERSELRVGESGVGRIARSKRAEVWRGSLPELWPGSLELTRAAGLSGGAGHPLLTDGKVLGVVVMLQREGPSAAALEGLASITDELALAIERSRALSALQLSEDRYRRLVEGTVEGICIHDGRRIQDCNPSLAEMVGYSVAEVVGRSPLDFMHPDALPDVLQRLATDYTGAYESAMVHRDGTVIPVEIKGRDFMHDGVKLRVTSVRDMTERKEAERTARKLLEERTARELSERSRAHAEFLADASRILSSSFDTTTTLNQLAHLSVRFLADFCIVTLLRDGVAEDVAIVHADPGKERLLEAAVGLWDERWQGDPRAVREKLGTPVVVPSLGEDELHRMAPDPARRRLVDRLAPSSLLSVPILVGGELIGGMLFAAGAAKTPYGAEELATAEELASRAAIALQSARSYHDAQAATAARDEMLAVVAHDLRNPLSAISMGSSLALEMGEERPAVAREQFELIHRTADHMNRLIQDLLDATRMQSGQLTLRPEPTRPDALVREAMETLLPLATHAGIALEADVAPDLSPVPADPLRLLQVISNLVGNALKFTPRGGRVELSVTRQDGAVLFRVTDSGPGIAPDQLPHVFGRFWQARSGDRRGLGLGLAIAQGVVDAHGGTIWVESTVGVGSSFLFTVPMG